MRPPPKTTVSEWADEYRYLSPEASSEPGRWNTARAEYQRGVMDALSDAAVTRVVCIKGAQVGWTEMLNNMVGYFIHKDPCPILVIQPTINMAETWSKDRVAPMIRDTPVITHKVRAPKSRDTGNTIFQKMFEGGRLTVIGANAPAALASRPIRIVLADEVDRYPVSAGSEGDPLALAAKRQITFWNRKTLIGSTPTIKGRSVVEREWLASDMRKYYVPCPACGHKQVLRWSQVVWDKDADGGHLPDTATYACETCGVLWDDRDRFDAIAKGEWRPEKEFSGVAGFHISGFMSPWLRLSEIVADFLKARNDPALLQVWVNTVLGDPWEETGETVDDGSLLSRREPYHSDLLPAAVRYVTAGVDVQADRLEVQFIGWAAREESFAVAYEVLHGDPAQQQVWDELDKLLLEKWGTEDGRKLRAIATCIDTGGHHAAMVYTFCRSKRGRRVFPIKGASGVRPIWPKRASKAKNNNQVFVIGVDTAKDVIYARLRIVEPGPGYCHFPALDEFGPDYFKQLTSENVMTRYKDGRPYRVWVLKSGQRNEALDTFVLALTALRATPARLDERDARPAPKQEPTPVVVPDVQRLEAEAESEGADEVPPPPAVTQAARKAARPARRVVRSNYMGR